jgi:hypothetical protein
VGLDNPFNGMDDFAEAKVPCEESRDALLVGRIKHRGRRSS